MIQNDAQLHQAQADIQKLWRFLESVFDFTLGTQLISTKGTTELRAERSDEALLVLFTLRHPSFSSWIFSLRVFHDRISLLSK